MTTSLLDIFPVEPVQSGLLNHLWQRQCADRYLSDAAIEEIARKFKLSKIELEGVVSFYHFFHRQPVGKYTIYLNNSIVSDLKGFERVKESFERETKTTFGNIDRTGTFGLFLTPCIGLSDQEPAALINFHPFTNLNVMKVHQIIELLKNGANPAEICDHPDDHLQYLPPNDRTVFFRPYEAGVALHKAVQQSPEAVIATVKKSELSGRGGAFFPTWLKWDSCRRQPVQPKFIVCNADEGEPGTFKDRVLMNREPQSILEGMLIAAYTVGARYGVIYLRAEYTWLKPRLNAAILDFYEKGLLGKDLLGVSGFDFDIRVQIGAGSYVCGEETALLESMEGKRGEPRTKWFFPVEKGYLQLPTIINNVETFAAVARIFEIGIEDYLKRGEAGSPGTKLISISGDCKRSGLYEIEWGMTVRELLDHCEAQHPHFIQVSGPSGECISMAEQHRRISMSDLFAEKGLRCGGSFMVFNRHRDIAHILLNFSDFFMKESCGICTPCRAGNFIVHKKLEKILSGMATPADLKDLQQWCVIMKTSSRCGLGKTACNTPIMAIEKFKSYFDSKLDPTFDGLNFKFDYEKALEAYERYKS